MESRFGLEIACAAMARSPLFQGIEPDELTRIALTMNRRRYRRLEVIFHEGDPGDSLHIIVAGRVKITRQSLDGDEAIIVTLGTGDSFGEVDGPVAFLPRRRALMAGVQEGVSLRPADDAFPVEFGGVGEDRQSPGSSAQSSSVGI